MEKQYFRFSNYESWAFTLDYNNDVIFEEITELDWIYSRNTSIRVSKNKHSCIIK